MINPSSIGSTDRFLGFKKTIGVRAGFPHSYLKPVRTFRTIQTFSENPTSSVGQVPGLANASPTDDEEEEATQ